MATTEQPKGPSFVFIRRFEEVDNYYLAHSLPLLLCIIGAYLLFVLKLGPYLMKNREPYKLKTALIVYNAAQVLLSAYLIVLTSSVTTPLFPKTCIEDDPGQRKLMLDTMHFYIFAKISELLDTIFFVLRKKYNQVTFLHVYHHASVVLGTWTMFMYAPSLSGAFAGFVNATVHVFMYFYYLLTAISPHFQKYVSLKKAITNIQLAQFVLNILHQVLSLVLVPCKHSLYGITYLVVACYIFYLLFKNFYSKSYKKPKKVKDEMLHVTFEKTQ